MKGVVHRMPSCFTCLAVLVPTLITALPSRAAEDTHPTYERHRVIESETLSWINWTRAYPDSLADYLDTLRPYFDGKVMRIPGQTPLQTKEGVLAVEEAVLALRGLEPLPPLRHSPGLAAAASDLVEFQGARGLLGHEGPGGNMPSDRAEVHGRWEKAIAEAISYGPDSGFWIVVTLIVDDGVPDRGHRETILDSRFRVAGVGFGFHSRYEYMCVIDFATGFESGP